MKKDRPAPDEREARRLLARLHAAVEALESGAPLDAETSAFVAGIIDAHAQELWLQLRAHPGRRVALATWEAARVVKTLVERDGASVKDAVFSVLPDLPDGTHADAGRITRAYQKLKNGTGYAGRQFPEVIFETLLNQARARLSKRNK